MSMVMERMVSARTKGVFLEPHQALDSWVRVVVHGPDAASFLQSQTTNDVVALGLEQGHVGARTTRTGHLVALFSCHRCGAENPDRYELIVPKSQQQNLYDALESMHFSDDLTISMEDTPFAVLQGPDVEQAIGEVMGERFSSMQEGDRLSGEEGLVVRRSLTGDPGFLLQLHGAEPYALLTQWVRQAGGVLGAASDEALHGLMLDAGWPVLGVETIKKRLLPEMGLERVAVSYTKGCYLGQEVIARVRTYGTLPNALRVLVVKEGRKGIDATLAALPKAGEPVILADGTKVGMFGSRAMSPTTGTVIAFVFLKKDHRSPGTELTFWGDRGPMQAQVRVAPLYTALDETGRVMQLYDQAVRVFAAGDEEQAIVLLEEALRLDPGFVDGYEVLGVIYGRQGKFHEAIDFFRRLEEVAPREPMVNTNLSLYYMKLGDKETAENQSALAAQKSMRRGRSDVKAEQVVQAQQQARVADANRKKGMFAQVLDFDPDDPIALFGMGSALSVLGEWPEAVAILERANLVDARNSAVYVAWGKALEALERESEAREVYRRGVDVASKRGDLMPLKEMEHRLLLLTATGGSLG